MRQIGSANVNPEANGYTGADVFVRYEGSIFLFTPFTIRTQQWIDENVQADAQWFGNALVVEHRYAADLAAAMRAAGLVLA